MVVASLGIGESSRVGASDADSVEDDGGALDRAPMDEYQESQRILVIR